MLLVAEVVVLVLVVVVVLAVLFISQVSPSLMAAHILSLLVLVEWEVQIQLLGINETQELTPQLLD